jgi:hypothetical protein
MLAVDARVAIELCLDRSGDTARAALGESELVAPPLLWSEVPSVLHELAFRREISTALADAALQALLDNTIGLSEARPPALTRTALGPATAFGWAKTYDAELPRHRAAPRLPPGHHRPPTQTRRRPARIRCHPLRTPVAEHPRRRPAAPSTDVPKTSRSRHARWQPWRPPPPRDGGLAAKIESRAPGLKIVVSRVQVPVSPSPESPADRHLLPLGSQSSLIRRAYLSVRNQIPWTEVTV